MRESKRRSVLLLREERRLNFRKASLAELFQNRFPGLSFGAREELVSEVLDVIRTSDRAAEQEVVEWR